MFKYLNIRRGFSLVEMLIAVAIIIIILAVVVSPLANLRRRQALNSGAEELVSLLGEARSRTIASLDGQNHGLRFVANEVELFQGTSYNSNNVKQTLTISPALSLSVNLVGGGNDIIFEKISGKTDQSGSLVLTLESDPSQQRTIIIEPTGLAYTSSS